MNKNTITGIVLIAAILFGFSWYTSKQAKEQMALQAKQDSINRVEQLKQLAADSAWAAEHPVAVTDSTGAVAGQPGTVYKDSLLEAASHGEQELVVLSNDKLELVLTTQGGQPYSARIKDYRNYDSTDLYLFRPGASEYSVSVYTGEYINTRDFVFEVAEQTDSTVVMRLPFAGGGYIEQKYTLHADSYQLDNLLSFVGMQNVIPRNVSMFDIDFNVTLPRMEKGYKNESQYSKLDYYYEGDKKPSEIGRGRNASRRVDSKLSWFAFQQQFFSAIVRAPQEFASGELAVSFYPQEDADRIMTRDNGKFKGEQNAEDQRDR